MKLNFFSRVTLILTILLLAVNMFSCKTSGDLFDATNYVFENQTDGEVYFVKVDTIDDGKINGRMYLVDDELTMRAEQFTMNYSKKKCFLTFSDSIDYVLKVKRIKDERIEGSFVKSSEKKKFVIYKYKADEYYGFNLGRYWEIGPQVTLFVPRSVLKNGTNEIVVFESDGLKGEPTVEFLDKPELGKV